MSLTTGWKTAAPVTTFKSMTVHTWVPHIWGNYATAAWTLSTHLQATWPWCFAAMRLWSPKASLPSSQASCHPTQVRFIHTHLFEIFLSEPTPSNKPFQVEWPVRRTTWTLWFRDLTWTLWATMATVCQWQTPSAEPRFLHPRWCSVFPLTPAAQY